MIRVEDPALNIFDAQIYAPWFNSAPAQTGSTVNSVELTFDPDQSVTWSIVNVADNAGQPADTAFDASALTGTTAGSQAVNVPGLAEGQAYDTWVRITAHGIHTYFKVDTVTATDTTPDPFTIPAGTALPGATGTSASVTPTGFGTATTFTVTDGFIRIDGGPQVTTGIFNPGSSFVAEGVADATLGNVVNVGVNIGSTSAVFALTSAAGPDVTVPVITLLGASTVNLFVGDTYADAGATALDNVDGDITGDIVVVSDVDTANAGSYTVRYNVSDAAGNAATEVVRTVMVTLIDVLPDIMSFPAAVNTSLNQLGVESTTLPLVGFASGETIPISVTGGQYSLNGGAYTTSAGTADLNDTIRLRGDAAATHNTPARVEFNANGVISSFSIITLKDPNAVVDEGGVVQEKVIPDPAPDVVFFDDTAKIISGIIS